MEAFFATENPEYVFLALSRKVYEAKVRGAGSVVLRGDGSPRCELLHVDDLAVLVAGQVSLD